MATRPRLLTIALSHYCEKARWALDRAGIEYDEEPHLPLFSRLHTARVGCGTVPVLITDSEILSDSGLIMRWAANRAPQAQLYPSELVARDQVLSVERYLDRELGPHARRWAYSQLLDHPRLLRACFSHGAPRVERLTSALVTAVIRPLIRRGYRVDASSARASLARTEAVFAEVGSWLADGRRYLLGDQFTAVDIAFASLSAPLVFPAEYGGAFPPPDELPAPMRADIERLRGSHAGSLVLQLYARERRVGQRP